MSTDFAAPQPGAAPARVPSGRDGAGESALSAGLMELIRDAVEYRVDDANWSVA